MCPWHVFNNYYYSIDMKTISWQIAIENLRSYFDEPVTKLSAQNFA